MADRLDIVAVGVQHEGAIVIGVILRPETRRAIVATARRHGGLMKGVDLGPVAGDKGDVPPKAAS